MSCCEQRGAPPTAHSRPPPPLTSLQPQGASPAPLGRCAWFTARWTVLGLRLCGMGCGLWVCDGPQTSSNSIDCPILGLPAQPAFEQQQAPSAIHTRRPWSRRPTEPSTRPERESPSRRPRRCSHCTHQRPSPCRSSRRRATMPSLGRRRYDAARHVSLYRPSQVFATPPRRRVRPRGCAATDTLIWSVLNPQSAPRR